MVIAAKEASTLSTLTLIQENICMPWLPQDLPSNPKSNTDQVFPNLSTNFVTSEGRSDKDLLAALDFPNI